MIHQFRIPFLPPVLHSPAVVEVEIVLQPAAHLWKYFGSTHRNNSRNHYCNEVPLLIITAWFHAMIIFPSVPYSQSLQFSLLPVIFSILNLHLRLQPSSVLLPIRQWVQSLPSHTIFHSRIFIFLLSMFVLLSVAC